MRLVLSKTVSAGGGAPAKNHQPSQPPPRKQSAPAPSTQLKIKTKIKLPTGSIPKPKAKQSPAKSTPTTPSTPKHTPATASTPKYTPTTHYTPKHTPTTPKRPGHLAEKNKKTNLHKSKSPKKKLKKCTTTTTKSAHISPAKLPTPSKKKRKALHIVNCNWRPIGSGSTQAIRIANDSSPVQRQCFHSIRHWAEKDEVIRVRDCVKICSAEGLENIGKIMHLHYDESSSESSA
jgi:hypothetical protein